MTIEEINDEIRKINDYLEMCLWMDFEFAQMDGGNIVVAGRIDTSIYEFAINIEFELPYYISSLSHWHLDDSKLFIELLEGDEMWAISNKYHVEKGNHIFRINAENFEEAPIIIASHGLRCEIVDEHPFS